jgi:hypothetical protein
MDELVITEIMYWWMKGMLFNIRIEEAVKVQAVTFIISYLKLNTNRKYKGLKIYMV